MKPLSARALAVQPSLTVALDTRYKALLAEGRDIASFGAGEPHFAPPACAVEAVKRAAGFNRYGALPGQPDLRAALSAHLRETFGLACPAEQILVTSGAKQAVALALLSALDPGDEVLIPSPYWVTYPEAVRLCGGIPVAVPGDPARGFKVNADALGRAVTQRTKALILNSPCNPTGAVYDREELAAIARVAEAADLLVLSDEIYADFNYTDAPPESLTTIREGMASRTVLISGFSKAYALQGWRLGYAAAPPAWAKAMSALQSHVSHHPSTLSQAAGLACLREGKPFLQTAVQTYRKARDFLGLRLGSLPGWPEPPAGAFYVWMDARPYLAKTSGPRETLALAEYLLEKHDVVVIPGSGFGQEGWLRLSFANSLSALEIAANRLDVGLRSLLA